MDLHRAEEIRFSEPGPVAASDNIGCSPSGDIYAIYSSTKSLEVWSAPIRRISIASRRVTEYPVPSISGYESPVRLSFDVSTNGALYALLRAKPKAESKRESDSAYLIVKYKDDGGVDSYFEIGEVPGEPLVQPRSLGVFADGTALVSGTTFHKTPDGIKRGYFPLFSVQMAYSAAPSL